MSQDMVSLRKKITVSKCTSLTCDFNYRNQLQNCPRFKTGDFDIDSLCTELASKARCTETGVAVPRQYVEQALWKLVGDPDTSGQSKTSTTSSTVQSTGKGGLDAMFPGLS